MSQDQIITCPKCGMRFDDAPSRDRHMDGQCVATEQEIFNDVFRSDESNLEYLLRRMRHHKLIP